MARIDVPAHERGTTRVFSLSMSPAQAQELQSDCQRQAMALGLSTLNPAGTEVFALSDLGDLGLAGYLRDGVDAMEADLQRDRGKLAALEGWVMLVHSMAFDGAATQLRPSPPLTLIGTYVQTPADSTHIELPTDAALPHTGQPAPRPRMAQSRSSHPGSMIVVLAMVAIALILWWLLT